MRDRKEQTITENDITTIQISRKTHKSLKDLKVHRNQSYDEVIQRLLKETEEEAEDTLQ